jgi:hypothetical protein
MTDGDPTFRFFTQLNELEDLSWASSRKPMNLTLAQHAFASDSLQDQLVRAIATEQAIPIKEVLECFEFVARVRKTVKSASMVDLCCGHGLVGLLFGIFERGVESVLLVDKKQPPSFEKLLNCLIPIAPWIEEKVRFETTRLDNAATMPPTGSSIVSVHACGLLTDRCIDWAIAVEGNVALMPCCYPKRCCTAPQALQTEFGQELAFDIDRTYRLENAGYSVNWPEIPKCITPMNRVIVGKR